MLISLITLNNCTSPKIIYDKNNFLLSQQQIFKPRKVETLEDMNLNYFNLYKAYLNNANILKALKEGAIE